MFCVRADDAPGGSARVPAVLRRDDITVAVNGGDDPRRAVALRDAISLALDVGELPVRPSRAAASGSVALVGGGPGDPELITVRGRRLVATADVVVVDRLAPRALLDELADDVEVIDCGKSAHRHNLTQDEINAVLIDRARAGKRVVRLKGGDPFVFGRGGEEWLACVGGRRPGDGRARAELGAGRSGVGRDPAHASRRRLGLHGRVGSSRPGPRAAAGRRLAGRWPRAAGTLVLLMAMDRLHLIAAELIKHGRAATTPAAVVHNVEPAPASKSFGRRWPRSPQRPRRPGPALRPSWSSAAVVDVLAGLSCSIRTIG